MEKTIEQKFFSFYEMGGFAHICLEIVKTTHDLNPYDCGAWERMPENIKGLYTEKFPKQILEQYEANVRWIDEVLSGYHSPLMEEIAGNIDGCQTEAEKERYYFALIKPFDGLAGILNPKAAIERCKADEKKYEAANLQDGKRLKQAQVERLEDVANKARGVLNNAEEGSPEYVLAAMVHYMGIYANRLYALFVERGLDLMKYQKICGVYLSEYFSVSDIEFYVGSHALAEHYMAALVETSAKPPQTSTGCSDQQPVEGRVPAELRTDKVEKVLSIIESVWVNVQGKGRRKAIDRSVFPWGYASRSSLRYIAGAVHDICKTESKWKPFENVTGKKNFMQGVKGRCNDVYYALQDAGYKVKQRY